MLGEVVFGRAAVRKSWLWDALCSLPCNTSVSMYICYFCMQPLHSHCSDVDRYTAKSMSSSLIGIKLQAGTKRG